MKFEGQSFTALAAQSQYQLMMEQHTECAVAADEGATQAVGAHMNATPPAGGPQ